MTAELFCVVGIENVSSSRLNLDAKKAIFDKSQKMNKKESPRQETSNFLCLKARKIIRISTKRR